MTVDALVFDLRYALRKLLKTPAFTLTAALTLGLGIGANTAIFTLVNALLLRPPPHVREPGRLVAVYTSDYSGPRFGLSSYADYLDFRERGDVFDGLVAHRPQLVNLSVGGETVRTVAELVSANYFTTLGVAAAFGRTFLPEEDGTRSSAPVAVIDHALWQRRFGGDSAVLGRAIRVNGLTLTVVGVAPAGFGGLQRGVAVDLWVPAAMTNALTHGRTELTNRGNRGWNLMGRLARAVTPDQAQARLAVVGRQLHAAYPEQWTDVRGQPRVLTVVAERTARVPPQMRSAVLGFMGLLMAVVGLVLLICCANVANLLLARATGRQREVAIRLALGASRRRLVRQLVTESVLLAALGGAVGILLAGWTAGLLMAFKPPTAVPLMLDLSFDARVLVFAFVVALLTGILFGLAPAMRATRPELIPALKDTTVMPGGRPGRLALRDALVVTQVATSLVLLIAAGLFLRTLRHAQTTDPGFNAARVALISVDLGTAGYSEDRGRAFYDQLLVRLRALPGVAATSLAESVPLALDFERRNVEIEGRERPPGEDWEFGANTVGPGYFTLMEMPLVAGREFSPADREGAPGVVIVNEAFARHFWPGESALGKRLRAGSDAFLEVVGVARDADYRSRGEEPRPFFYVPFLQRYEPSMTVHVRTVTPPGSLLPLLRREVKALDRDLPVAVSTAAEQVGVSLLPQRLAATLLTIFGLVGMALAAIGLYGVIAYSVSRRTREIGIRIALGATARDVRGLVVREGMKLTAVGLGVGLLVAFAAMRLIGAFLFGVTSTDPLTFVAISILLAATALLASYLPARRATRVDPMQALRYE